jgi:crotonobetainyl-CoA:carnitine CoA-transferase CaiB-like acyl-CoA transferase
MLLADLGADVLMVEVPPGVVARFDRMAGDAATADQHQAERRRAFNPLRRNKRSIAINLREARGRDLFHQLVADADVVLDGFRPGVTTRLGVDYETLSRINERVITCSITGFGQSGALRDLGGHDINYIAMSGALSAIGTADGQIAIPLNLLADFAGGGMLAAVAILAALQACQRTGRGQAIDLGMSDGALYLMASAVAGMLQSGAPPVPGRGVLAGSVPYYNVYACADGGKVAVGAIEPHFYEALCRGLGLERYARHQHDVALHLEIHDAFAAAFLTRPRDEWFARLRALDACVTPVLDLDEAFAYPHTTEARSMRLELQDPVAGIVAQVGVAPKLSATPGAVRTTGPRLGEHTDEVLTSLGVDSATIAGLRTAGIVA